MVEIHPSTGYDEYKIEQYYRDYTATVIIPGVDALIAEGDIKADDRQDAITNAQYEILSLIAAVGRGETSVTSLPEWQALQGAWLNQRALNIESQGTPVLGGTAIQYGSSFYDPKTFRRLKSEETQQLITNFQGQGQLTAQDQADIDLAKQHLALQQQQFAWEQQESAQRLGLQAQELTWRQQEAAQDRWLQAQELARQGMLSERELGLEAQIAAQQGALSEAQLRSQVRAQQQEGALTEQQMRLQAQQAAQQQQLAQQQLGLEAQIAGQQGRLAAKELGYEMWENPRLQALEYELWRQQMLNKFNQPKDWITQYHLAYGLPNVKIPYPSNPPWMVDIQPPASLMPDTSWAPTIPELGEPQVPQWSPIYDMSQLPPDQWEIPPIDPNWAAPIYGGAIPTMPQSYAPTTPPTMPTTTSDLWQQWYGVTPTMGAPAGEVPTLSELQAVQQAPPSATTPFPQGMSETVSKALSDPTGKEAYRQWMVMNSTMPESAAAQMPGYKELAAKGMEYFKKYIAPSNQGNKTPAYPSGFHPY